jgi:hypothetical protein
MKSRWLWASAVAFLVVVTVSMFVHRVAHAGTKVEVGRPCAKADRPSLAEVDHAGFDALLRKYVDERGLVAYARWKASAPDMKALDDYLAKIGCVDLHKSATKPAELAYWINVYNALTLKGILREYPTSSIKNHVSRLGGYNIWKDLYVWIDGKGYSLDYVEHQLLRKMGEPRIHFAVVCASKGCPPLVNKAYTADNLDAMLAANAKRYFAQPANFKADPGSRTVYISQLIKWYGTDFASAPAEQLRVLRPYIPYSESLGWFDSGVTVNYLDYDWSLNDQQPGAR